MIGNAVPVALGEAIGKSIATHLGAELLADRTEDGGTADVARSRSSSAAMDRTYEEWRDAVDAEDADLPAIHAAWIDEVLQSALEVDDHVLRRAGKLPERIKVSLPEHGVRRCLRAGLLIFASQFHAVGGIERDLTRHALHEPVHPVVAGGVILIIFGQADLELVFDRVCLWGGLHAAKLGLATALRFGRIFVFRP